MYWDAIVVAFAFPKPKGFEESTGANLEMPRLLSKGVGGYGIHKQSLAR